MRLFSLLIHSSHHPDLSDPLLLEWEAVPVLVQQGLLLLSEHLYSQWSHNSSDLEFLHLLMFHIHIKISQSGPEAHDCLPESDDTVFYSCLQYYELLYQFLRQHLPNNFHLVYNPVLRIHFPEDPHIESVIKWTYHRHEPCFWQFLSIFQYHCWLLHSPHPDQK